MKRIEITTHEAKTHLSRYLALLEEGATVVIKRGNVAIARLVPVGAEKTADDTRPAVGTVTSEPVTYTPDCFDPLSPADLENWGL